MRFITTIILVGAIRYVVSAAIDVMHAPVDDGPLFVEPTDYEEVKFTPVALMHGNVWRYTEAPRKYPNLRKRIGPLLEGWRSGSVPVPRFDQKTQKKVNDYLTFYGESKDGQFGTDKVHVPNMNRVDDEWIPSGLITAQSDTDSKIRIITRPNIYKQGHTGVYNIEGHPGKVIKYHAYCFDRNTEPFDATVVESYFMTRIARNDPDIALKVDFYSGYDSTSGSLPDAQRKVPDVTCQDGVEPHIRYMIMDKVGSSIFYYIFTKPDNRIDFFEAMKMGKEMIQLIKRLHSLDIVHGDVHWGNFASRTFPAFSDLILIDFGRAKMVDKDAEFPGGTAPGLIHPYASFWELTDCRVSFRNDVYRTVQTNAMFIYGMPYFNYLNSLHSPPSSDGMALRREKRAEFTRIKREADFWELNGPGINLQLVLSSTDEPTRQQIRNHLASISTLIIEPALPYSKPNYDGIIAEYESIIAILSPPAEGVATITERDHPESNGIREAAASGVDAAAAETRSV